MNHHVVEHLYQATPQEEAEYAGFLAALQARFNDFASRANHRLYMTNAAPLWLSYLAPLSGAKRQYHTCNACRHFVDRFGSLVHVHDNGRVESVLWGDPSIAPSDLRTGVQNLKVIVEASRVEELLVTDQKALGNPVTGDWTHMAVRVPAGMLHRDRLKTPDQIAAVRKQEAGMTMRALQEFDIPLLDRAISLLKSGAVARQDKFVAPVQWLRDLSDTVSSLREYPRRNRIWRASVEAPSGFTHIRASAVGTLLQDLAAGKADDAALAAFEQVIDPLNYMRPTAPVVAGNIKQAEAIVEKLGLKPSFDRRMATMDDLELYWTPPAKKDASGGMFDHLKAATPAPVTKMKPVVMTWDKFQRTILPTLATLHFAVPSGKQHYTAITTAVDPTAPPLLAWDRDDARNPAAWYRYAGGSVPAGWGLTPGAEVEVLGICKRPCHWRGFEAPSWGNGDILILRGCRDRHARTLGLFPEFLRSELREVRSTVAAHSNSRDTQVSANDVAGVMVPGDNPLTVPLIGRTAMGTTYLIHIDRWD